jgi:NhaA family Na+:H+ antiporter
MNDNLDRLPEEPLDRFTMPFMRFMYLQTTAGAFLLFCTLFALVLSNSSWSTSFLAFWETQASFRIGAIEFSRSLKFWINDGLMTLFFFLVALELKRAVTLGEMRNPRMVALPIAAALGGMIVPAGIFLFLEGSGPGAHGWGIVMATDTAFVIGCLALLGSRIPHSLRLFLLSISVFDDIGAILVVAIASVDTLNWAALGLAGLGLAVVAAITHLGIRNMLIYLAVGVSIWFALDASGIHPTLAGVMLGLMTSTRSWVSDTRLHAILDRLVAYPPGDHWSDDSIYMEDLHRANVATIEVLSPVERFEILLHPWVIFTVMPLFALANAGVPISLADINGAVALAIFVALVVGKPIGVILFSYFALKLGLAIRPFELSWNMLVAGSLLTGIGFTMALFIAELAFVTDLLNSAKLAILGASGVSAICGLLALAWLTSSRRRSPE